MKRKIVFGIFVITSFVYVFSLINIVIWFKENDRTSDQIKKINSVSSMKIITINDELTNSESKFMTINFDGIKEFNEEIIGWINIPYTDVNYPILKHNDNSFYLNHSIDKSKNKAGWIFMDYRNEIIRDDKNIIIYGHNRKDGTMFGSLKNILKESYLKNKEKYIYVSTPENDYRYEIFSAYYINTTDDYLKIDFNDYEYSEWLNLITNRSMHDFKTNVDVNDSILTLSTCYTNSKKLVVHAKMSEKK